MTTTDYLHFRQNFIKFFYYNIADLLSYRAQINKHNYQIRSKFEIHKKNDWVINIEQNL